jgi:hypothetical protein
VSRETRQLRKRLRAAEAEARRLRRREMSKRLHDLDERMLTHAEEDATIRPDARDPFTAELP